MMKLIDQFECVRAQQIGSLEINEKERNRNRPRLREELAQWASLHINAVGFPRKRARTGSYFPFG